MARAMPFPCPRTAAPRRVVAAPRPTLEFMRNPFATQWSFNYDFETMMFWLQDTWTVTEQLSVNFGFAALSVEALYDFRQPLRTPLAR